MPSVKSGKWESVPLPLLSLAVLVVKCMDEHNLEMHACQQMYNNYMCVYVYIHAHKTFSLLYQFYYSIILFLFPEIHLMVSSLYCIFQGPRYLRLWDFSVWRPGSHASSTFGRERVRVCSSGYFVYHKYGKEMLPVATYTHTWLLWSTSH